MDRPLITLDFETYYQSRNYTLKKLTYLEYIRHELFKIHGVGVLDHEGTYTWYDSYHLDDFKAYLDEIGEDVEMLCHNVMFDGMILHLIFGYHPEVWRDTQGMSRGMFIGKSASLKYLAERLFPDDKTMRKGTELVDTIDKFDLTAEESDALGDYCRQDCHLTRACYDVMLPHYPDRELELIDLTLQMYCDPILEIDVPLTQKTLTDRSAERDALIKASGLSATVLGSNLQFKAWIEAQGIEPPMKISLKTEEITFAGGKSDLEFQVTRKANPALEHVWAGRIAAKSTGEISRAERFLQVAELAHGKMPVALSYYSAHTGRYGGTQKTNLQNLGRKSRLRRALTAPKNSLIYVADSSNIEARMNNWNAGQDDMVQLFRDGADVYSLFAGETIYRRPINKDDDPVERFVGKVAVLGLGYGMGDFKFRTTLATGAMGMEVMLDQSDAYGIVQAYRAKHHEIVKYWKACDIALAKMLNPHCDEPFGHLHLLHNMIVLPNGMALQYPGLRANEDQHGGLNFEYYNGQFWKNIYGGQTCENITQALSRIVLFEQMLNINDYVKQHDPEGRVVLNVHDEIIVCASDFGAAKTGKQIENEQGKLVDEWANASEATEFYLGIEHILRQPLDWCLDLPLDCEGGFDLSYSK